MPVIKTKPSLNHKVINGMTKEALIDLHPDADEAHLISEWEKATADNVKEKAGKKAKQGDLPKEADIDSIR